MRTMASVESVNIDAVHLMVRSAAARLRRGLNQQLEMRARQRLEPLSLTVEHQRKEQLHGRTVRSTRSSEKSQFREIDQTTPACLQRAGQIVSHLLG